MKSYWDCLAHQFQHQQPPLRPCREDMRILGRIVRDWHRRHSRARTRVLLFGVTPEIARVSWPANTFLLAVERSQAMIDRVWPGNMPGKRRAVRGNWFDIGLKPGSFDFVVGDGFSTGLRFPDQYAQLADTVSEWLRPEGLLIARLFVRTKQKETHAKIRADLQAGRVKRFDVLKWRLGMALQKNVRDGMKVDDIYRAWKRIEAQWPALAKDSGWPRATVDTIRLYEGREDRYAFPTIEELTTAFARRLQLVSVTIPDYDFGHCCPTLVFRRRAKLTPGKGLRSLAPAARRSSASVPRT